MNDTATLDPPVQQQPPTPPAAQGDLRTMLNEAAQAPNHDAAFKAEPQTPEKSLDSQSTDQKPAPKPKVVQKPTETAQKPDKPKTKWGGLEALKSPESEKEDVAGEQTGEQDQNGQSTEQKPSQEEEKMTRWKELRATEDRFKEIAPAYEKLQKDFEELKAKSGMTEEQKTRMEHLEQMYAVELLDQKPEFQNEVLAPMQEQLNSLKSIADHAGLDANQRQALRAAAEERDNFTRIRSIKQVLGATTRIEDPEEIQTLVQFALEASGKYQEAVKKQEGYVHKAAELAHSVRGKEAQQSQQEKAKKEQEYSTAHKEMIGTLRAPLQQLFDDPEYGPELNESLNAIRPADTPMDQAYQAQAGEILPFAVKFINKLLTERDAARKSLKARQSAQPKTTDGTTPQAEQGKPQQDLKQLLSTSYRQ